MNQTLPEVITATIIFIAFWLVAFVLILVAGRYSPAISRFRQLMLSRWKPALAITTVFVISTGLGSSSWINPYAIAIFCQAMIGLAIAATIPGYTALSVSQVAKDRRRIILQVLHVMVIALVAVFPALIIGTIGLSIGRQVFGEIDLTQQATAQLFTGNKWLVFFSALGGAGIAEELTYRLMSLSLIWKITCRSWLAILLSSLIFGAYHLTPLTGMYLTFRQFPISQFLASTLIGLVWGYLFVKHGLETAVLGHALSDWLPLMLFA